MVKSYMSNTRAIILAMIPCNVNVATQEILKLAEIADPDGTRTMAVLTKPDLATENATRDAIMNLVLGKRNNNLKLGYYIVKNRSADNNTSTLEQRAAAEYAFFLGQPWSAAIDRCGVQALKDRLRHLLLKICKQELPHVKAEISQRWRRCKANLEMMGPAQSDDSSQRQYLGKLANIFQTITRAALNGHYSGKKLFKSDPDLKLITRVFKLQNFFASTFRSRAHLDRFESSSDNKDLTSDKDKAGEESTKYSILFNVPLAKYHELQGIIIEEDYKCPRANITSIMNRVQAIYKSSRRPDLSTFGGIILSTIFKEQAEKWEPLTLCHISRAIILVHDFIVRLLRHLCHEEQVLNQLWDSLLVDRLGECYCKAMKNARFLLSIELQAQPSTFNHYFNDMLQKKRGERLVSSLNGIAITSHDSSGNRHEGRYVPVHKLQNSAINKDNDEQVCEDILDVIESYYKVAQKRFVDVLYQQAIMHFLLEGDSNPLKVFGPDLIMSLDSNQLELIAGEDEESKHQRATLKREAASLEAALKVL